LKAVNIIYAHQLLGCKSKQNWEVTSFKIYCVISYEEYSVSIEGTKRFAEQRTILTKLKAGDSLEIKSVIGRVIKESEPILLGELSFNISN
jgi:hypothetical protein